MKKILLFLLFVWCTHTIECQKNYYVDCSAKDNGNGTIKKPWNTLSSVNSFTFKPGDSLLIRRGTISIGELWPKGSGNEKLQITIDAYGKGPMPIIDAQGADKSAAIRLSNQEYWTIQNLEVTNNAQTIKARWGIYVISNDSLVKHRIHIKNNTVRNVYASYIRAGNDSIVSFYGVGGIYVKVEEPGKMDDVLIEGNMVKDVVGVGICFWGESEMKGGGMNWDNLSPHVVVRRNSVVRTGADGILILGTDNVLIEYNLVDDAGHLGKLGIKGQEEKTGTAYIAGLWPTRHRGGLVQYNEVCNTHRYKGDGQSFDNDVYVSGSTIFQYNYSHDNEGGFFLDCCTPETTNTGTIIRYNISQNDGRPDFLHMMKGQAQVYNNVFYSSDTIKITVETSNNYFYNNIFWSKAGVFNKNIYDYNCYFGGLTAPGSDTNKVIKNPMLISPGSGKKGFESLGGYVLSPESPCLNNGKIIPENAEKDFWGNPVPASTAPGIGAYKGTIK